MDGVKMKSKDPFNGGFGSEVNTKNITLEAICGTWNLESFEQTNSSGRVVRSHSSSCGVLIYTASGGMSVSMCRVPDSKDPDTLQGFVRDIYYAGRFRIDDDIVFHIVEVALLEHHRGQALPRRAHFEDEGRVLVLEALNSENKVTGTIVWRRS